MTEPPVPPTTPPPATPPPPASGPASSNRSLMIVLSYLGLLALIPLLVEKDDREVQWHAKHGLVLFAFWVAVSIALSMLSRVTGAIFDPGCMGCLWAGPSSLVWLAAVIVHVLAILKGLKGERFIIPGISPLADKF